MTVSDDFTVEFAAAAIDRLMPMHLLIDEAGTIVRAGPTLAKLRSRAPLVGSRFFDRFEVRRPQSTCSVGDLADRDPARLHMILRDEPKTPFKGHAVKAADGATLLNLSFGISVVEAVTAYNLTAADFAPTELAVEMLYLVEAKSAAMEESRKLNLRLQGAKIAAEKQAFSDALTGLRNRRGMEALIAELIERGTGFGLMHIDLDYFKEVNDSHGHAAGDQVLVHVARLLRSETREFDSVIRFGGDEFVIIMREMTDTERLSAIARRIIGRLEEPIPFEGQQCRISASIGVTTSGLYAVPDVSQMLKDADKALYRSKERGRSRATIHGNSVAGDTLLADRDRAEDRRSEPRHA